MNTKCVKCGKQLGYAATVEKKKMFCKKCRLAFEKLAVEEFGLKIVYPEKQPMIKTPEGFEIVEAA